MRMVCAAENVTACTDSNNKNKFSNSMESFDKIEAVLAEIVEQENDQKKQSGELGNKLDSVIDMLSQLEDRNEAAPPEPVSMITLKDHEAKMKEAVAVQAKWLKCYKEAKALNDALLAERPYWATKVWPVKAFKWVHQRRYWFGWVVYGVFTMAMSIMVHINLCQRSEISDLRETQMKYRFINAGGYAPRAVQFLEDAYEQRDGKRLGCIEKVVADYEKSLKQKADSIARAERRKLERF